MALILLKPSRSFRTLALSPHQGLCPALPTWGLKDQTFQKGGGRGRSLFTIRWNICAYCNKIKIHEQMLMTFFTSITHTQCQCKRLVYICHGLNCVPPRFTDEALTYLWKCLEVRALEVIRLGGGGGVHNEISNLVRREARELSPFSQSLTVSLSLCVCVSLPCEDTVRRCPFANQKRTLIRTQPCPETQPWSWSFSL